MKKYRPWFLLVIIGFVVAMLWNAFSQPGLDDFYSTFTEIDLSRNENNTGPVDRVYIITSSDSVFSEMELYGKLMPYSKQGTTKVYFFHGGNPYPKKAERGRINFDAQFEQYCLAVYQKNSSGQVSFRIRPFN